MRCGLGVLVLAGLLFAAPGAISVWAATDHPPVSTYLQKVPACNPALGGDCAAPSFDNDDKCTADSDCALGCLKDDDSGQLPRCMLSAKASTACVGASNVPQKGVTCGCMPDSHKCGYLPLPVK